MIKIIDPSKMMGLFEYFPESSQLLRLQLPEK